MVSKIDKLRKFLNDTVELNVLNGAEESSDDYLRSAIEDALEEINEEFEPETSWTIDSIPSWNALKFGATIQILIGKGILSARNMLTYSDAGGVSVSDYDKYGRYINYFNVLINKYLRSVQSIKRTHNIDQCYGEVASEYSYDTYEVSS
jgi:hypothetical protein